MQQALKSCFSKDRHFTKVYNQHFRRLQLAGHSFQQKVKKCISVTYETIQNFPIQTGFEIVCQATKRMIFDNRDNQNRLGLQIVDQTGKGKGVRVLQYIQKDELICSYIGAIGTNQNALSQDDSLFELGIIRSEKQALQILIIGRQCCNVGRYFNSVNQGEAPNIRAQIVFIPMGGDRCQPNVVFIANRNINIGQYLEYTYTSNFWNQTNQRIEQEYMTLQANPRSFYEDKVKEILNEKYKAYPLEWKQYMYEKCCRDYQMERNLCQFYKLNQPFLTQTDCALSHNIDFLRPPVKFVRDNSKQFIGRITPMKELVQNYQQPNIQKHLRIFAQQYQLRRSILGDGNCFYRIISFLCVTHKRELLPILYQRNSQISKQDEVVKAKINNIHNKDEAIHYWNNYPEFDKFLCLRVRKLCGQQIQNNLSQYEHFDLNQINQLTNLNNNGDATDITVMAAANKFNICLYVTSITPHSRTTTILKQDGIVTAHIFLRAQHYELCYEASETWAEHLKKVKTKKAKEQAH